MKPKPNNQIMRSTCKAGNVARKVRIALAFSALLPFLALSPGDLRSQSPSPTSNPAAMQAAPQQEPPLNQKAPPPNTITNILADIAITQTNDPFASSSVMRQKATIGDATTTTLTSNVGSANLKLHGIVIGDNDHALALISLGKAGIHVVREGDHLSLSTGSRAGKVSIVAIHRKSIEIEYGTFNDSVIIR